MKNTKLFANLVHSALISLCAFGFSSAFAAATGQPANSSAFDQYLGGNDKALLKNIACQNNSGNNSLDCVLAGYGLSMRGMLFLPVFAQGQTMAGGNILSTILSPDYPTFSTAANSKTSNSVVTLVSNTGNVADQLLASTPGFFAKNLVLTPAMIQSAGSSTGSIIAGVGAFFSGNSNNVPPVEVQDAINSMSFDTLIAPMTYQARAANINPANSNVPDQQKTADTFIQYVSGMANPFRPADFTKATLPENGKYNNLNSYLVDLQKNLEVRDYLTSLRNYTAQLSVGIGNLYYLYNERTPITDPKMLAEANALMTPASALPVNNPPPPKQVSALAIMQYMATRRIDNPDWYNAAQNAAPATLMREMLFIMAEIPPMLFQVHLDLERILATMSTMQMQQANSSRLTLETQRDKVENILTSPETPTSSASEAANQATEQANQAEIDAAKKALKQ